MRVLRGWTWFAFGAWLLVLQGLACNHAPRTVPARAAVSHGIPECEGSIVVLATPGVTPHFTWIPDCRLRSLAVQTADARHMDLWVVNIREPGSFSSGVTYGEAPAGAKVCVGPRTLRHGESYLLTIRNVMHDGTIIAAEGTLAFSP